MSTIEDQPKFVDIDMEAGEIPDDDISKSTAPLPIGNDPFAPREGKTLLWRNINMTLKGKKGEQDKQLLQDVWGEVPQKQTTAIMGPSGAGKTSLLNILAGRAKSRGSLSIESDIRLNNYKVDPTSIKVRKNIAFVAQDDSLLPTATPREAIFFSAKLRLPKSSKEEHILKLVDRMLEELGLEHCADTIVGGPLLKGISGGERKRTSVGVELVTKPSMVFLDEPTSGLDSYSAIQLCNVLKNVANAGASVLFTIHQPASEIFTAFDRLILMNKGRVMYTGPVTAINEFFETRGHPIPPNYNPADWIMNVAQSNELSTLEKDGFFPKDTRALTLATKPVGAKKSSFITSATRRTASSSDSDEGTSAAEEDGAKVRHVSIITQTSMLFVRELRNLRRDKQASLGRFIFTTIIASLIGIVFYDVGESSSETATNLNSRFGAMTMALMAAMFGTAQPALLAFPQERPVFLREYSTNHYSVVSYFLSRLTVEFLLTALQILVLVLISFFMIGFQSSFAVFYINAYALAMGSTALAVMLGCTVEDPSLAQEMLPVLFVPQMLFAGFFVSPSLMPSWLRWARYIFALTYSMRIGVLEEFSECEGDAAKNCQGLIESLEADEDERYWYWLVICSLFVFYRLLGLFFLRRKATKFF